MLQISVSVLYFINKVLLSLEKKSGWQVGILASSLAIIYFFSLKLYLLMGLEISFLALMVYGFLNHSRPIGGKIYVYLIIATSLFFMFLIIKESRFMEFAISFFFIFALYFLAIKNWNAGWSLMVVAHALMAYYTFEKQQYVFSLMQGLSCFVAVYAIISNRNRALIRIN